jgi:alpha-1,3-mannosyl-glycoprotein beta-1,2-N-acetylglucosaminyltransferase
MFQQIFSSAQHIEKLIILEDDMDFAVDFFDYFLAQSKILDQDETVMCISAWNDHGKRGRVADPKAVYRTDVFPGLGWMLTRKLWEEFEPKWPTGFWDDWMREDDNARGRSCIFPEINRVYTFGEEGSSGGQFFNTYLRDIQLNDQAIDWKSVDLTRMQKKNYDSWHLQVLSRGKQVSVSSVLNGEHKDSPVPLILRYTGERGFAEIANEFGMINDFKANKPRASYKGVVLFRHEGNLVALVPLSMKI